MEININQKKITVGDKYKIFIDGQHRYSASKELFKLFATIHLFDVVGGGLKLTINKRHAWFKAKYDITLWDKRILHFQTKSFWRSHFHCYYLTDLFDI